MASKPRPAVHEADAAAMQHLITHRRELHAAPELSFKEIETAHYIAERLDALGVDKMTKGVGGTGVVADIRGERPGRAVLVRADMDGLPLTETADVPFRSTRAASCMPAATTSIWQSRWSSSARCPRAGT